MLIQMFQWQEPRRGTLSGCLSGSIHVPTGISGLAGWFPAVSRLPRYAAEESAAVGTAVERARPDLHRFLWVLPAEAASG